jgi:RNA polymerase sigma-70 factor (ECF subfamily)
MLRESTHASLLLRVRDATDQKAWREFDARYRDLIVLYCHRLGLQRWDAEDVRQTVMLNLSRALRSFDYDPTKGTFRSYLGRSVRNAIRQLRAREGVATEVLAEESLPAEKATDAEEVWEAEWRRHHLRLALESIRDEFHPQSMMVFERLLQGRSVAETAQDLSLSVAAVHKVKQRIQRRLQEQVEQQVQDEQFTG